MQNDNQKIISPDFVYMKEGKNAVIPSKTSSYKRNPVTGEVVLMTAKTHQFENNLRREISIDLMEVEKFPTKKEVFISVTHNLHSKRAHDSCDLDNRAKTVLDALKGVIYDDDNRVKILLTQKHFLKRDQVSSYHISVTILAPAAEKVIDTIVQSFLVQVH